MRGSYEMDINTQINIKANAKLFDGSMKLTFT